MRDAAAGCPTLPPITFFRPTLAFFEYLDARWRGKPVIDVGAGTGHMTKLLRERGWDVLPIDPFERDGQECHVMPIDAVGFDYPPQSLPIMARPCHGIWVDYAIRKAMESVPVMLYVGLRKNFDTDLGGLDQDFDLSTEKFKAGQDGERVVTIRRKQK